MLAIDEDAGQNGMVRYFLETNSPTDFEIDEVKGSIRIKNQLDHERCDKYELKVN